MPEPEPIRAVDAHVAGHLLRLVTSGFPTPRGRTLADRARWLDRHARDLMLALLREPRGHGALHLALLTEPTAEADAGLLVRTLAGFRAVSGSSVIAAVTIALEHGLVMSRDPDRVRLETAAGPIDAHIERQGGGGDGRAPRVSITVPPAFVLAGGLPVSIGSRVVRVDVAWAGEFLAIVDTEAAGVPLASERAADLARTARAIAAAVAASVTLAHPARATVEPLAGIVFTGPADDGTAHLRALPVSPDGVASPGPTAESVAAVAAVVDAMGLTSEVPLLIQGASGAILEGRIAGRARVGELPAVAIEIAATAFIVAEHLFPFAADDPLAAGFEW